ncbi:LacI family transcriptional regulator [Ligilactobacillus salitolerans]|uniref:LacI family transcriptional regulator n=1 Tax=Ligilactobacillus salitolerans TaxID=1808352 RepID=A0A401IRD0_9LACO|nr:LacI family DNA-binding transcriptional regulator [Ligilactobacillus salitolerans]GBG94081.1 LacI family transcriptional regulator [Ligilactobacillus salitolerans]
MTTLKDVADQAHVSRMTVSRVINHPDKVTAEVKELVYQAMQSLNYHPNAMARALVNNRTQIVKLLVLEEMTTVEPYYMNLLTGISKELEGHQYALQLVTENSFEIGSCDGYIITGMRNEDYEWIRELKMPFVLFGENRYGYDFVDSDNKMGGELGTRYAIQQGYQHLIYIGIDLAEPFEYSREAGYLQVMQEHGLEPRIIRSENHSTQIQNYIMEHWADYAENTIFICASDRLALGVERAIITMQGSIPEQYGIIGHDSVFLDQVAFPKLTTVKQEVAQMGGLCAKMLLNKIMQNNKPQGNCVTQPQLIIRDTTK